MTDQPSQAKTEPYGGEAAGPPLPMWLFNYIINPLITLILRSPLHGRVSQRVMLLTFTGRKSGRTFTTPVGYFQGLEPDVIWTFTDSRWWQNLRERAPVTVLLQGEQRQGYAQAITDPQEIAQHVQALIEARGIDFAKDRLRLKLDADQPSLAELAAAVQGRKFIPIELL